MGIFICTGICTLYKASLKVESAMQRAGFSNVIKEYKNHSHKKFQNPIGMRPRNGEIDNKSVRQASLGGLSPLDLGEADVIGHWRPGDAPCAHHVPVCSSYISSLTKSPITS